MPDKINPMSQWPKEWTGAKHPAVVLADAILQPYNTPSSVQITRACELLRSIPELEAEMYGVRDSLAECQQERNKLQAELTRWQTELVKSQEFVDALRAQGARVPDGWQLVPVEPTDEMLTAAARASMKHLIDCINDPSKAKEVGSEEMCKLTHASRYHSMLSSAPTAPQAEKPPYTTIDMGYGKWKVGAGTNADVPCIAFGKHGSGRVGELITLEPRQMSAEETHAVITFANAQGLGVLQEKMDEVRAIYFSATQPTDTPQSAPSAQGGKP
jgi:hypothetical protein